MVGCRVATLSKWNQVLPSYAMSALSVGYLHKDNNTALGSMAHKRSSSYCTPLASLSRGFCFQVTGTRSMSLASILPNRDASELNVQEFCTVPDDVTV